MQRRHQRAACEQHCPEVRPRVSSTMIFLLFLGFCRLCSLMYSQILFTTCRCQTSAARLGEAHRDQAWHLQGLQVPPGCQVLEKPPCPQTDSMRASVAETGEAGCKAWRSLQRIQRKCVAAVRLCRHWRSLWRDPPDRPSSRCAASRVYQDLLPLVPNADWEALC